MWGQRRHEGATSQIPQGKAARVAAGRIQAGSRHAGGGRAALTVGVPSHGHQVGSQHLRAEPSKQASSGLEGGWAGGLHAA